MRFYKPTKTGAELPTLNNAAAADEIMNGKEAINGAGNKVTGTHVCEQGLDTSDATAAAADIMAGKTAYAKGSKVTGNHSCPSLASMTSDATAAAADIMAGKTAYAKGAKVTGNHSCPSLESMTSDGTAISDNILKDRVAYVKGQRLVGTMGLHEDTPVTLNCGESHYIIGGYHTGDTVTANSLASQTPANAAAADIASGKTAWVNGVKVTGEAQSGGAVEVVEIAGSMATVSKMTAYTSLDNVKHWSAVINHSNSTMLNGYSGDHVIGVMDDMVTYIQPMNLQAISVRNKASFSNGTLTINPRSNDNFYPQNLKITFYQ